MNPEDLATLARRIAHLGGVLPTFVLVREMELFEVEFAALEFAEESVLPLLDWGGLAVANALRAASPRDIDQLLGLGELVSEDLMRKLLDERLLSPLDDAETTEERPRTQRGLLDFFRRLRARQAAGTPDLPEQASPVLVHHVVDTSLNVLRESTAPANPRGSVAEKGAFALEHEKVVRRRRRPLRMIFSSQPLHYFLTVDEKKHKHSQHRRGRPLEPEQVPRSLLFIDEQLALPSDLRARECGIASAVPGVRGELIGVVPGSQWEVRRLSQKEERPALLVLAAFTSPARELTVRAYSRLNDELTERPHIDSAKLLGPMSTEQLVSLAGIPLDVGSLRADGSFLHRCQSAELLALLSSSDQPEDTYVASLELEGWSLGTRLHVVPRDDEAGRAAYFEYLARHDSGLRSDFDVTCATVRANLAAYWEEDRNLPTMESIVEALWSRAELRGALCRRRLDADLVAPYERQA